MNLMKAMQISTKGGPFESVNRELRDPEPGFVRVKVEACGVCHSDIYTKEGIWPGLKFPRIPGHEVAGTIDAIGPDTAGWGIGDRVGIGWHGGHCGYCENCRRGDFVTCQKAGEITGITIDGGYAQFMNAHAATLARIPEKLSAFEAAPLMCAGVTTYNSLRNSGARAGDTVAVVGVGGLGHLGVQFASNMGFRTIAIARGKEKEALAKKLGAHDYIDSDADDPAAELTKRGGADVILATVTDARAMTAVLPGLRINGKLIVLGGPREPLEIPAGLLIGGRRSVAGWPSGSSIDSEDTLNFCALTGVRSVSEFFSLEDAAKGYDRMITGKARFRVVLRVS